MMIDWIPVVLTLKLACATTMLLLIVGVPLACWLTFSRHPLQPLVSTVVTMPLVLPPSVLGFYLLILLGPNGPVGRWTQHVLGMRLVFSFAGLVIGASIFSLPFMVNAVKAGLASIPRNLIEASYSLGKGRLQTVWSIVLPHARPAVIGGSVMSFAHTIGAFGIILMLGGNIPGQTRVASVAIYSEVEAVNYTAAHAYSLTLLAISFFVVIVMNMTNKKSAGVLG